VPFGEQPHQQPVNEVSLPHENLVDFISHAVDQVMLFFDFVFKFLNEHVSSRQKK